MSEIDKYYLQPNQATPIDGLTEIAPGGVSDTPLQPTAGETTQTGDSTSFPTNKLTSQNYVPSQSGWALKENGDVEFGSGKFRGDITGASGTFSGTITASAGTIGGFSISATALTAINFSLDSSGQRLTLGSGNDILIGDADDATYRLWIGNATAASAPFSVGKDGSLTATGATISGALTATSGAIGGFDIGSDYIRDAADSFGLSSTVTGSNDVRFFAGTTFANRANAPFRTFEDGSTVTSNLTVTGGSISIGGQAVVNTDGSSEFLNTLIGRQQVTVDNTANLNTALSDLNSAGGGILYLKAGTYTLSSALTFYSNITIRGISQNATILDFNNTGAGLVAAGSNVYTTGTLTSITSGVNVTGSGTSWLANVTAGQQLFLNNRWHVIAAVNSDTSITLAESYGGPTVTAGTSYRIASPMVNIALEQLTVKNATGDGFNIDDVREVELSNLLFLDCNVGFTMTNTSEITTNIVTTASCTSDGYQLTNVGFGGLTTLSSAGNGGNGATINNMNTVFVSTSSCTSNTGDGYNLTDVSNSAFIVEASANGGQGIELVSGCDNNFIYAGLIENNTSDGIKLTATCDNNTIGSSCNVLNNGGYGVNIAASTCDDNLIIGVHFDGNTSGEVNDSGTGTVVQACLPIGINDTSDVGVIYFGNGDDGAATFSNQGTAPTGTTKTDNTNGATIFRLDRDVYYSSCTIDSTVTVLGNGFRFFCSDTLTNNGTLSNNGGNGTTAGAAGTAGTGNYFRGGNAGGTMDNNGQSITNALGGAGGDSGTYTGGTVTEPAAIYGGFKHHQAAITMRATGIQIGTSAQHIAVGGGAGGAGGANGGDSGGTGGGGGGLMAVSAKTIVNTNGIIRCNGGNGGNGSGGNAEGGGGGGGGVLVLVYKSLSTGTEEAAGGTGGTGVGSGANGNDGNAGLVLNLQI